jgi:hypothetical protein
MGARVRIKKATDEERMTHAEKLALLIEVEA